MGWSTREIAELAGTSLRSVRHYHDVGLLPEPERRSNGYKQYGVAHLVRLLRIKRLADLGFSLPQIAELGDGDEHPAQALRALDEDLAAQADRLAQLRAELADILEHELPTDLPSDLAAASTATLSETDRNLVTVMGRTLGAEGREVYADLLRGEDTDPELTEEFEVLDPDADEATRDRLAARFADAVLARATADPRITRFGLDAPGGLPRYLRTVRRAMEDLYNPAQLDVMNRMIRLFRARWDPETLAERPDVGKHPET
ncbi:MerR family transcriptional regulator [Actinomycetospora sp. NBRC 106378]|uniref:helix-turn-helix domain-containing protein n=1 Tax=Actinomycetospora sp. NBRC 106378 TaxID=3032208 RepID=UPI0024A20D3F|nr:MerR family transcriptional regulator [Actinomycetospora sp. NBRC 106378]GLZ52784.1 transcriptional regulator, MerR family protein [Actinomycetospora sp. NBRC 106378]